MNVPAQLIIKNYWIFWSLNDVSVDKYVLVLGKDILHSAVPRICRCIINIARLWAKEVKFNVSGSFLC
jgi:hypothetical protein